jgi:hypothetical protein
MNHKNIIIIYDNFDSNESFEQILSLDIQDHADIVCHEKKLDEATRLLKPGSLIFSFNSFVYDEIETQVEKILLIRKKNRRHHHFITERVVGLHRKSIAGET